MRNLVWGALAAGFLLVGFNVVAADDTVRLGGPSVSSGITGGVDTELVRGGHFGGGHYGGGRYGGFYGRGYYGGGGFYGRSYYGGGYYGRGYYGGYYRPYYYGSYYRPYYTSYYSSYYQPSYYGYSNYNYGSCYSNAYSYYPIAGEVVSLPATTIQGASYYQTPSQPRYVPQMPPADNGNSTYQYDGGPRNLVPMPNQDSKPANAPRGVLPADGKLVSLSSQPSGGISVPFTHQPVTTTTTPSTSAPRISYPAYGDEPITPAPRKASR